jgi:hypothetical protein
MYPGRSSDIDIPVIFETLLSDNDQFEGSYLLLSCMMHNFISVSRVHAGKNKKTGLVIY